MILIKRVRPVLGAAAIAMMFFITVGVIFGDAPSAEANPKKGRPSKHRKVLYEPTGYERIGILLNKGREYKYHLFSTKTPLKLEIDGTTQLDVKVRLLYGETMKGLQKFSLLIEEDGLFGMRSKVASYSFTTEKSRISTLKDGAALVPSQAHGFKLIVPDGPHRYTLSLKAMDGESAAIRILIPKRDLQPALKEKKK